MGWDETDEMYEQQILQRVAGAVEEATEKLQAENAELRKLLSDVRADLVARAEMDPDDGGAVLNISNGLLMRIDAAMKEKS